MAFRGLMATSIATLIFAGGCASSNPPTRSVYPILPERVAPIDADLIPALTRGTPRLSNIPETLGADVTDLERLNALRTDYYRREESPFYATDIAVQESLIRALGFTRRPWPTGLPRLCIAMSGGGLRSAAVNLGVLQELLQLDEHALEGIDAISAVSGGAYTLSWLYYQAYYAQESPEAVEGAQGRSLATELLKEPGPYIERIDENARSFGNKFLTVMMAPLHFLFQPVLALGHLVSGRPHIDSGGILYYVHILNTFHTPPGQDGVLKVPLRDLRAVVEENGLPLPIISVAVVAPSRSCRPQILDQMPLSQSMLQITPLRAGAADLGYTDYFANDEFSDLTGIVSSSGAALDRPGGIGCQLLRLTGLKIGTVFRGLNLSTAMAPPLDDEFQGNSSRKSNLRLLDGGFVDNLAVYPLVERGCQNVVVVDASYDPSMNFCEFFSIRKRIREEMGLEFVLQGEAMEHSESLCGRSRQERRQRKNQPFAADQIENPVLRGSIRSIPFRGFDPLAIEIAWLKLSVDQEYLAEGSERYAPDVARWYLSQPWQSCVESVPKRKRRCPFPHKRTSQQAYSAEEFRAYRHLGADLLGALVAEPGRTKARAEVANACQARPEDECAP